MLFGVIEFYLTLLAESVRISNLCVYSKNEPKIFISVYVDISCFKKADCILLLNCG